jgi:predicted DNA binding CopG/RHH family protein
MEKLDKYEREILDSYNNDEWESISNIEQKKSKYSQYAKNTLLRNKKINIKVSEKDFVNLKAKSFEEGISYQDLISSILHKFITGKLIEK